MRNNLLVILVAVVAFGVMCLAQDQGAPGLSPEQMSQQMRADFYRIQAQHNVRPAQAPAAGERPGGAEPPKASYRIQVMLLCIAENADQSKLVDIRAAAQENGKNSDLFGLADKLIADNVGIVAMNPTIIATEGSSARANFKSQTPHSFTEQAEGKTVAYTSLAEHGFDINARVTSMSAGRVSVTFDLRYFYGPQGSIDRVIPSIRTECSWSGDWSGSSSSQAILLAETPRKPGTSDAVKRPQERYLLMGIEPVQ